MRKKYPIIKNNITFLVVVVCVDSSGVFLTAKHCVTDEKLQQVNEVNFHIFRAEYSHKLNGYISAVYKPTEVLVNKDFDIAFMMVNNIKDFHMDKMAIKKEGVLLEGESEGCLGYPITQSTIRNPLPNLFSGIISRVELKQIEVGTTCDNLVLDMSLHPGNSGGPIFNSEGELIAIVSSQELRKLDKIDNTDPNFKIEFEKWRAWTNLIHCVPYTVFMHTVSDLKRKRNG